MKNTIQGNFIEKHPAFIYAYTWKFCSSSVFNSSHFPESIVALTRLEPLQDLITGTAEQLGQLRGSVLPLKATLHEQASGFVNI